MSPLLDQEATELARRRSNRIAPLYDFLNAPMELRARRWRRGSIRSRFTSGEATSTLRVSRERVRRGGRMLRRSSCGRTRLVMGPRRFRSSQRPGRARR
jgi:hypothetical protein